MSEAKFNPEILSGIKPEIYEGSLNVDAILSRWYAKFKDANCGAFITFVGIVRAELRYIRADFAELVRSVATKGRGTGRIRAFCTCKRGCAYPRKLLRSRRRKPAA